MLQSEFEKLIGKEITADEFRKKVEPVYMNFEGLDKTDIARLYLKLDEVLFNKLVGVARDFDNLESENDNSKKSVECLKDEINYYKNNAEHVQNEGKKNIFVLQDRINSLQRELKTANRKKYLKVSNYVIDNFKPVSVQYDLNTIKSFKCGLAHEFYNDDDINGNCLNADDVMFVIEFKDGATASFVGWSYDIVEESEV